MTNGSTTYEREHHVQMLQRGASFSLFGSKVATVAYPMLVLFWTRSPSDAGWMGCAIMAPCVVAYVPAGALVDRWPPRRALMISESLRGLAILAVILLIGLLGKRSFPWLIIPAVIEEFLGVFSMLAEQCYLGRLVDKDIPAPTLARGEAQTHTVVALGRPLGGVLFGAGLMVPFIFDFVTFVASVILLFYLRTKELGTFFAGVVDDIKWFHLDNGRNAANPGMTAVDFQPRRLSGEIKDGLKWIYRNEFARVAIPLSASSSIVAQALVIIFLALASHQGLSPFFLGAALGASGFGGVFGSVLGSKIKYGAGPSRLMILVWIWAITLSLAVIFGSRSLIALTVVMVIFGFTGAMGNIELNTYLMASADESMLGRVFSIRQVFCFGAYTVGPMLGGLLAGRDLSNGVRILFWLSLIIAIVSSVALMWSCRRSPSGALSFVRPPMLGQAQVSSPSASSNPRTNDSEERQVPVGAATSPSPAPAAGPAAG